MKSLDLWSSRAGQIRTCRGKAPPSCLRKTVLLLKSPTGAFVASQTQTFFSAIGGQSVLKSDGLGAILVVERDQHPVIVQENGIYKSDNMQEKLSLVNRFGCTIYFGQPSQKEYFDIVLELAKRQGINKSEEWLCAEARKWELNHGGISGRTAQQFLNYVRGVVESGSDGLC